MIWLGISGCNNPSVINEVQVVSHADLQSQNDHYLSNRQPLQPAHFIKLPLGAIQPEGWILKLLELQKDGLAGNLGEISAWLDKNDNAWLSAGGDHGWEEVPYWLRGIPTWPSCFRTKP